MGVNFPDFDFGHYVDWVDLICSKLSFEVGNGFLIDLWRCLGREDGAQREIGDNSSACFLII